MADAEGEPGVGWPFADPPDAEVIVLGGQSPLVLVTHDADEPSWQFLDGEHVFEEDGVVVTLAEMLVSEPNVAELADLRVDCYACRRGRGIPWQRAAGEPPAIPPRDSPQLMAASSPGRS